VRGDGLEPEEADELEGLGPDAGLLAGDPGQAERVGEEIAPRAAVDADHDVLEHRHGREQREVLEGPADTEPGDAMAGQAEDGPALEQDVAVVGRVEAAEAIEERGLAGAVGPDESHDLPGLHLEGDPLERDNAPEPHRDVAHGEQGRRPAGGCREAGHGGKWA
jgi:hypothetical protein